MKFYITTHWQTPCDLPVTAVCVMQHLYVRLSEYKTLNDRSALPYPIYSVFGARNLVGMAQKAISKNRSISSSKGGAVKVT